MTTDFSSETEGQKENAERKEHSIQNSIPLKTLSLGSEQEIKTFSDEDNLREHVACGPTLKDILKIEKQQKKKELQNNNRTGECGKHKCG